MTYQELFGEIRQHHVEHLGQVRKVYLEATGEISVFFHPPEQVRPGLPIFPEIIARPLHNIAQAGLYACDRCGHCQSLLPNDTTGDIACNRCGNTQWLVACNTERVS